MSSFLGAYHVDVDPIYYCAGFKEEGQPQGKPYNLSKLLYYIIKFTPKQKRLVYIENLNQNQEMWKDDDELKDYRKGIVEQFFETVSDCVDKGSEIGGAIGSIFGETGRSIGEKAGAVIGGAVGILKSISKRIPWPW